MTSDGQGRLSDAESLQQRVTDASDALATLGGLAQGLEAARTRLETLESELVQGQATLSSSLQEAAEEGAKRAQEHEDFLQHATELSATVEGAVEASEQRLVVAEENLSQQFTKFRDEQIGKLDDVSVAYGLVSDRQREMEQKLEGQIAGLSSRIDLAVEAASAASGRLSLAEEALSDQRDGLSGLQRDLVEAIDRADAAIADLRASQDRDHKRLFALVLLAVVTGAVALRLVAIS